MKRNPELAHKVSLEPDIIKMRHTAIDKITSASMAAQMLSKYEELNAVDEIELEVRVNELLDDAGYWFRKYLREKIFRYENELHKTLDHGNQEIIAHSDALNALRQERGI